MDEWIIRRLAMLREIYFEEEHKMSKIDKELVTALYMRGMSDVAIGKA